MTFDQRDFQIRCEWGLRGVQVLAPVSDVVIVVDVLSFSTSVDIAVARGAIVFPFPMQDTGAADYAASMDAQLAARRRSKTVYSLSPESLLEIEKGTRLVLPSPNGARLSLAAEPKPV